MSSRRLPVVTITFIALNVVIFLGTHWQMDEQGEKFGPVRLHVLMLAALHPDLKTTAEEQQFVHGFQRQQPAIWQQLENPRRKVFDEWDDQMRTMDADRAQEEMDSLGQQLADMQAHSITLRYGFVPQHPAAISYITSTFLHGGWMHIIFNMWFLWLAGIILEDTWGRVIYPAFYLIAGAAACQFDAWMNPASIIPSIGASGAVAGLMGAFLARFPNTKIEMLWMPVFRVRRFKAPAFMLLPLWLLIEIFYGALFGSVTGVAHWAHVGGFVFGALAALGVRYSGLEAKAEKVIDAKVTWTADPRIVQAHEQLEADQLDQAITSLQSLLAEKPDSIEGLTLLQQLYSRTQNVSARRDALVKLAQAHLKAREPDAAWQDYEDFVSAGGEKFPASPWLEICRHLESQSSFERALGEYAKLALAYPAERQSLLALMSAGRLCIHKLNRPADAVRLYEAAQASPVPHLDWENTIQAGLREANNALSGAPVPVGTTKT
ncbi:MAG TPA: rhomboid family intramembrane serine protease [Candidatus Acidoferrales bacterium]|nr:rhomboid family intramembrane serine protease [Candidatus Acidoferrales bacterium]